MAERISAKIPDFIKDKQFQEAQDLSFTTGKNLLSGNLPDFYKSLGKTGGTGFENMLSLINRDVTRAVGENAVRRQTVRSGVGGSSIAKAVADSSTKLRYADVVEAAGQKQDLLKTGLDAVSGVRAAGLAVGGQENTYGMQGAQLNLQADQYNADMAYQEQEAERAREDAKKAAKNQMWSDILSAGIGAAGTILGGPIGGAIGSKVGGMFGSAIAPKPNQTPNRISSTNMFK